MPTAASRTRMFHSVWPDDGVRILPKCFQNLPKCFLKLPKCFQKLPKCFQKLPKCFQNWPKYYPQQFVHKFIFFKWTHNSLNFFGVRLLVNLLPRTFKSRPIRSHWFHFILHDVARMFRQKCWQDLTIFSNKKRRGFWIFFVYFCPA